MYTWVRQVNCKLGLIYKTLGEHTYAFKFNLNFTVVLWWFTYLLYNSFVFSEGPEIKSVSCSEFQAFHKKVANSYRLEEISGTKYPASRRGMEV